MKGFNFLLWKAVRVEGREGEREGEREGVREGEREEVEQERLCDSPKADYPSIH